MRNLDDIEPESPQQGFQFPGVFEITALGNSAVDLTVRVPALLEGIGLNVLDGSLRTRPSREGNYLSVTVSFTCPDRERYDAAHEVLRADPDIRWTL
jgi:putative lipoic acid-binding regulatory protein